MALSLNHLAIVSKDVEQTKKFLNILDVRLSHEEVVETEKVQTTFFPLSESLPQIEILTETTEDPKNPIYKFRQKYGSGIHHIALNVPAIDSIYQHLKDNDIEVIGQPRPGAHQSKVLFVHPRSTGGILFELVQKM